MRIAVELPNIPATAKADQRYFKEALVAILYQTGDISSKEGCEALNVSRREFEELLPRFGVSVMPDDDQNISVELNA